MKSFAKLCEKTLSCVLSLAVGLIAFTGVALAQVPSTSPPYNIDLGGTGTTAGTPLIKLNATVPSTLNSAQQSNLDKNGVICMLNFTASSGSPTATMNIQNFDAASQLYYTIATASLSTPGINVPIGTAALAGTLATTVGTVTTPSSIPVSRYWRVQQVLAGANTTATGTVSCNLVK